MNILFDLDGTISDPFKGISTCINYALSELGHKERDPENLTQYIGPPLTVSFEELLGAKNEGWVTEAIRLYRERYNAVGFRENVLYPDTEQLLGDIAGGANRIFIATSKGTEIAECVIEYFKLNSYFDKVYGSELGQSKRGLIERIIDVEQLNPDESVMIGDRSFDIHAGNDNGLKTIGVLWGYGSREELEGAQADAIVSSFEELKKLLLY